MVLIQCDSNENRYLHLFSQQHGYGMPKYRGSPMIGGSFWGRIIGFAKGLFSKAAPHISSAIAQAQPHVKHLASKAIESAIDTAVEKVSEKLKSAQEGRGRRRKRIRTCSRSPTRKRRRYSDKLPDQL
jgi:hypothetical protein